MTFDKREFFNMCYNLYNVSRGKKNFKDSGKTESAFFY